MSEDLDELFEQARAIARTSRDAYDAAATAAPPARLLAADVAAAHEAAERTRKPVDTLHYGHPVTVYPTGQVPIDQGRKEG